MISGFDLEGSDMATLYAPHLLWTSRKTAGLSNENVRTKDIFGSNLRVDRCNGINCGDGLRPLEGAHSMIAASRDLL